MAAVRYRTASSAARDATATVPGHGKLLVEPELENHGYVTNVNQGTITSVNLDSRATLATLVVNPSNAVSQFSCGGKWIGSDEGVVGEGRMVGRVEYGSADLSSMRATRGAKS